LNLTAQLVDFYTQQEKTNTNKERGKENIDRWKRL